MIYPAACQGEPILGESKGVCLLGRREWVLPRPRKGSSERKRALEGGSQFPLQVDLVNLDYSRVEVAAGARRRVMKLWSSTANGPQQSRRRCEERSDSGNPMLLRMNMRSPRFARDDNFS